MNFECYLSNKLVPLLQRTIKIKPSESEKVRVKLSGSVFYLILEIQLVRSVDTISLAIQNGCLFCKVVDPSNSDIRSSILNENYANIVYLLTNYFLHRKRMDKSNVES